MTRKYVGFWASSTIRTRFLISALIATMSLALVACGSGGGSGGEAVGPCPGWQAGGEREVFGDLHVHNKLSFDAYFLSTLNGPHQTAAFARGEAVRLPCPDDSSAPCATVQLDRPLDFLAYTDHSEFLGVWLRKCGEDGHGGQWPALICGFLGDYIRSTIRTFLRGDSPIDPSRLPQGIDLTDPTQGFQVLVAAANAENQECRLAVLPGYEFSPLDKGSMRQRNVFFQGSRLPPRPVSTIETMSEWDLWDTLERDCEGPECDFLTIPHNSNMADGRLFPPRSAGDVPWGRDFKPLTAADAYEQARHEPAVEIFQHKGQSECQPGLGDEALDGATDPACAYENLKAICAGTPADPPHCLPAEQRVCTTVTPTSSTPDDCTAPLDMVRNVLVEGLRIRRVLGVNPWKFGFVGATDTHNATPGFVFDDDWPGHGGVLDIDPSVRFGRWSCDWRDPQCTNRTWDPQAWVNNPGGLTGAWVEENTRQELFEAIRRRETFATSGPRFILRTWSSWSSFPTDACRTLDAANGLLADQAFTGVPMGSNMPPRPGDVAPHFLVWGQRDKGNQHPTARLQRLQMIKGWSAIDGTPHVRVYDVAGSTATPSPSSDCAPPIAGAQTLCAEWIDPAFDPTIDAVYYVRMLAMPTCRWSTSTCVAKQVDCTNLSPLTGEFPVSTGHAGYEGCCRIQQDSNGAYVGTNRFDIVQERAWASPVWYEAP